MKTKRIRSYNAFVRDGRHYYPRVSGDRLILPDFKYNEGKGGNHHRHTLCCESVVFYNRNGLVAVAYVWFSRFGSRKRMFYYRNKVAVTWRSLTWDERVKVCAGFIAGLDSGKLFDYHPAPTRHYLSWALQKRR